MGGYKSQKAWFYISNKIASRVGVNGWHYFGLSAYDKRQVNQERENVFRWPKLMICR